MTVTEKAFRVLQFGEGVQPCLLKISALALAASAFAWAASATLNVQIKEYEVPTPKSRPHDPALAPDGSLWYAGQATNKLGRLDPKTGEFKEYFLTTPNSGPHGLVWYSESGMKPNTLVRFDPKSKSLSAEQIPSGGGVVRNMVATPDRRLYLACSGVNKVAVVETSP